MNSSKDIDDLGLDASEVHESTIGAVPQVAAGGGCCRLRGASTMLSMHPLTSSSTPTISWSGAALKEKFGTLFFRDGLPAVRHLSFEVMISTQSAHGMESPSPSYRHLPSWALSSLAVS